MAYVVMHVCVCICVGVGPSGCTHRFFCRLLVSLYLQRNHVVEAFLGCAYSGHPANLIQPSVVGYIFARHILSRSFVGDDSPCAWRPFCMHIDHSCASNPAAPCGAALVDHTALAPPTPPCNPEGFLGKRDAAAHAAKAAQAAIGEANCLPSSLRG